MDRRINVLHLEDSGADAELLLDALRAEWPDLACTVVDDEQGFTAGLRRSDLDVIIADYNVPAFNGLRALEAAREARPDVPFIFCSGMIGEDFAIETLRLGATDYVLKNRLGRLVPAVQRALREAAEVRGRREAQELLAHKVEELRGLNEQLEGRVRQRTAALEEANCDLEAFAYTASHDLRTPLRAIEGYAALLLGEEGQRLGERGLELAERVRHSAERMSALIEDLGRLSRVNRAEVKREAVDLGALVGEILGGLAAMSPERRVRTAVAEGVVAVCDRSLGRMLCATLLENAWKFTRGSAEPRIDFGAQGPERERVYFVRDNGAGFDMAQARRLFQPFERLPNASGVPGAGIGLAVAARIVSRHGGRIWADSAPAAGTTVYFTLGDGGEPSAA